jgi:ribosome biogenesis GTPase / thiamine phosphate phosphatase
MELADLGYDAWLRNEHEKIGRPDLSPARITRVDRDRYLVRNGQAEVLAEPTGKLLFSVASSEDLPCVGDWCLVQFHNDGELAIIHELLPRRGVIRRRSPARNTDYQMIAANIDVAFIVQSCDNDFNLRRMERYLVIAHEGGIEPVILLSKSDLASPDLLAEIIREIRLSHIDTTIIAISNVTPGGFDQLRQSLHRGKTYALLGSSGVGKTTLVNQLLGREEFITLPVRETDDRGRHATTRRQLSILDSGALVIDMPGMRELGLMDAGDGVTESFPEIHDLSAACRFHDCTHTVETGCAVLQSVAAGEISEDRYESYLKLKKESDFYGMTYLERRQKEKAFGKMVNSAMKQLRKGK